MKSFLRLSNLLAIIVFVLLLSLQIFSQEKKPLITDRPDFTESVFIVPINHLQIETGFVYQKQSYDFPSGKIESDNLTLASTLFRYGVIDQLEFRFGGSYFSGKTTSPGTETIVQGLNGLFIGAKYNLIKDSNYDRGLAVLGEFALPFGNENLRPEKIEPKIIVAGYKSINSFLGIGANVGFVSQSNVSQLNYFYSVSLGFGLSDKLSFFVEYLGRAENKIKPSKYLDAGFTYLHRENLQIDVSAGKLLDKDITEWFGNMGFSLRLPN